MLDFGIIDEEFACDMADKMMAKLKKELKKNGKTISDSDFVSLGENIANMLDGTSVQNM